MVLEEHDILVVFGKESDIWRTLERVRWVACVGRVEERCVESVGVFL